jgi:hypothetical protein
MPSTALDSLLDVRIWQAHSSRRPPTGIRSVTNYNIARSVAIVEDPNELPVVLVVQIAVLQYVLDVNAPRAGDLLKPVFRVASDRVTPRPWGSVGHSLQVL